MSTRSVFSSQQSQLQRTTSTTHLGKTNPLGLKASQRGRSMSMPDLTKSGHVASSTPATEVSLGAKKDLNNKRVQILQLQVQIAKGQQLPNSKGSVDRKARAAFEAFALAHQQNLSDNRKGTAHVYTLPEFFWSKYGDAFDQELHDYTLAQIQEYASNPEFENAVFVLGTMVTAKRPESLVQFDADDVGTISDQLEVDLRDAFQEAISTQDESYTKPTRERVLLATVGDMLNAEMKKHDLKPDASLEEIKESDMNRGEAIQSITARVKTMNRHVDAMKSLFAIHPTKFPNDEQIAQFNEYVTNSQWGEAKAMLAELMAPFKSPRETSRYMKSGMMRKINAFFQSQEDAAAAKALMKDFKTHFQPKILSPTERRNIIQDKKHIKRSDQIQDPAQFKKWYSVKSDSSMYKSFENKAVVIEGGTDGQMKFVNKVYPSDIDSPHYDEVAYSVRSDDGNDVNSSFRHESFQSHVSKVHPQNTVKQVQTKSRSAGIDAASFMFESPKTGLKLGVAICRDYSSRAYQHIADESLKGQIDHLQIVSAGVDELDDKKGMAKSSVALNDGLSQLPRAKSFVEDSPFRQDDGVTHIIKYDDSDKSFSIEANMKKSMFQSRPIDFTRDFAMDVSPPLHLQDGDDSSVESFETFGVNSGINPLLHQNVSDARNTLEVLYDQIDQANHFMKLIEAEEQKGGAADYSAIYAAINQDPFISDSTHLEADTTPKDAKFALNQFISGVKKNVAKTEKILSDGLAFLDQINVERLRHQHY
ncbi:hypothetical protein SCOR_28040 [Sulfidibacter corallicola]|uniref:Uncharacterized protein n=1 Tax=Sulfidibacter corallicola TaxID=2818388 RepID=A0A8A4TNB5_SULCO|nr:hypothetical protein [Sulfidibacter corallicola]QTD50592.1 hypothetical protein J3U87_33830 [Sulfidibacter corallicola]